MSERTRFESIVEGFKIIHKYDTNAETSAGHDQIWVGDFGLPMTEEEKKLMDEMGWFKDEDSWSRFF